MKVKEVSRSREDLRFEYVVCCGVGRNLLVFVIWREVYIDK